MTTQERFWGKVEITTECWIWRGSVNTYGYPLFWDGEKTMQAVPFLLGHVERGFHRHHLCRNKLCVRPDHLRVIGAGEHVRLHAVRRKTCPYGHSYSGRNERQRVCRTCLNEATRLWRARQKVRK